MKSISDLVSGGEKPPVSTQEAIEAQGMWEALRQKAKLSNEAQIRQRREDSLQWCGLGRRFLETTFDNYEATTPEQQKALEVCRRFGTNFSAVLEKGSNLIMLGNTGTGKTHLAGAILTTVIRAGRTGRYYTIPSLIREIRSCWERTSEVTERQMLKRLVDYDLLIIDEVGLQYGTDAEKITLFEVVNGRYEQMRPTIVISNLTLRHGDAQQPTIDDALGDRLVDRLRHNGVVLGMPWESKRIGK